MIQEEPKILDYAQPSPPSRDWWLRFVAGFLLTAAAGFLIAVVMLELNAIDRE